jgi:uncharacterized damage-inducible protein DinB
VVSTQPSAAVPAAAPRNVWNAILDEWDRARRDFVTFAKSLPAGFLDLNVEGKQGSVLGILAHVATAAYSYPAAILRAMDRPVPPPKYPDIRNSRDPAEIWDALEDIRKYNVDALAGMTDQDLGWIMLMRQRPIAAEFLMEHAIVHFLKHRRQLERAVRGELKTGQ